MKNKSSCFIFLTLALLLFIAALFCTFYLATARIDTTAEFSQKRFIAYLHFLLWPLAMGLYLFSRLPEPSPSFEPTINWMAQTFGARGGAAIERLWIVLLVAGVAWYVSSNAMQGEYSRMVEPEKRQDWVYWLIKI